jgi:hypothetical protein
MDAQTFDFSLRQLQWTAAGKATGIKIAALGLERLSRSFKAESVFGRLHGDEMRISHERAAFVRL